MANGLQPYDPNPRSGSARPDDPKPSEQHFHYHDHRTFVQADSNTEDLEDEEPEPILRPWQKNAIGLILTLAAMALLAHYAPETVVTTNTVTEVPAAAAAANVPVASDDAQVPPAAVSGGVNTMAMGTTADQMLEEWSGVVTGKRSTSGFLLVNGSGSPGESCNAHEGKHLLKFGSMLGGQSGVPIPDYFGGTFLDIGAMVGGSYWYNNQDNILITRRLEMKQINGDGHKSLENGAEKIEALSPGIVTINGVRFHQCVLK